MASLSPIYALLWGVVALIIFKIVNMLITRQRRAIKSRELGCKPAPIYPSGILGISGVRELMKHAKTLRIPTHILERREFMCEREGRSVNTWTFTILGTSGHFTVDPKNVQAILATQFKDFGLGDTRINNFHPLLGDGIVSVIHHLACKRRESL